MGKGFANQTVIPAQAGIQNPGKNRSRLHSGMSQLKRQLQSFFLDSMKFP